MGLVKRQCIFPREFGDFRHPANHRLSVGVGCVHCRVDLLSKERCRIIFRPLAAFFTHHIQFRQDILVGKNKVLHPVGLKLHHQAKPVAGDTLIIGGVIARGEGVALATIDVNQAVKDAKRVFRRALEHQMFEKMREAGFSGYFVGGADPVPHHVGDHGGTVIRNDHHFHAIGKLEAGDFNIHGADRQDSQTQQHYLQDKSFDAAHLMQFHHFTKFM